MDAGNLGVPRVLGARMEMGLFFWFEVGRFGFFLFFSFSFFTGFAAVGFCHESRGWWELGVAFASRGEGRWVGGRGELDSGWGCVYIVYWMRHVVDMYYNLDNQVARLGYEEWAELKRVRGHEWCYAAWPVASCNGVSCRWREWNVTKHWNLGHASTSARVSARGTWGAGPGDEWSLKQPDGRVPEGQRRAGKRAEEAVMAMCMWWTGSCAWRPWRLGLGNAGVEVGVARGRVESSREGDRKV
ncbi:hypothetical protein DM02DRAFT_285486 [Periconia macrospinosa]|uniref:Uncharacterized protein n=1 Tax=Periconia macrospinosa TaxID=97972 RepID=A0A2V1ED65_9PLEO|nr:hypothetical protein DM02DRAFT_285486 [Periconia macrospinosa]